MDEYEFVLPFDAVFQAAEHGMAALPMAIQYEIVIRDLIGYILEELSVKISDYDATSANAMAMKYLTDRGVDETQAWVFSNELLDATMSTVIGFFPSISYQELATARCILHPDGHSLLVYIQTKYIPQL